NQLQWNLGTLAPGATGTLTFQLQIVGTVGYSGQISDQATATADGQAVSYSNTVSGTLGGVLSNTNGCTGVAGGTGLYMTKVGTPAYQVAPGGVIYYTITLQNT